MITLENKIPKVDAFFVKDWKGTNTATQVDHAHKCPICGVEWKCRLALHEAQQEGLKPYLEQIQVEDREPCMADLSTSCARCPESGVLHGAL